MAKVGVHHVISGLASWAQFCAQFYCGRVDWGTHVDGRVERGGGGGREEGEEREERGSEEAKITCEN